MPRNIAIVASLFLLTSGAVFAGDFAPRAGAAYAPGADEAGARSLHLTTPVSMAEAGPSNSVRTPDADSPATINPPRAAHLGADAAATDAHALPPSTAAADGDDKPVPDPHKAHARRWQSLLPGVMK